MDPSSQIQRLICLDLSDSQIIIYSRGEFGKNKKMDKVLEANKEMIHWKNARGVIYLFFHFFIQTLNLPILLSWEYENNKPNIQVIKGIKKKRDRFYFFSMKNCMTEWE